MVWSKKGELGDFNIEGHRIECTKVSICHLTEDKKGWIFQNF